MLKKKIIIRLKQITKAYGEVKILDHADLEIEQGTITALTGKSGIGKTSILKILSNNDTDYSGEYNLNIKNSQRYKIGIIPQRIEVIENWTVYENVMLPLIYDDSVVNREIRFKVEQALDYVGMESYKNRAVKTLSTGQKQRVVIARTIVNNPDIILADEPTASLDEKNAYSIFLLLKEMCKKNVTIVLVTHDMDLAEKCDYLYEIRNMKINRIGERA